MFRLPKYLDEDLVRTLADYLGLEIAESRDVRRRGSTERGGRVAIRAGVAEASGSGAREQEEEESFSAPVRPVRLLNDVIDSLIHTSDLVQLDNEPDAALPHRSPIEVSGTLKVSPVSDVAAIFTMLLPMLQSGADLDNLSSGQVASMLLERRSVAAPSVVELQPFSSDYRFVSVLRPSALQGDIEIDDLEGEFTVFGTLDRVLAENAHLSLEQHMVPGLNRTLRRALGPEKMSELLGIVGNATGRTFDVTDLHFTGPGALIGALAVYP